MGQPILDVTPAASASPERLSAVLLGAADPKAGQSMRRYGRELHAALSPLLASKWRLSSVSPPPARLSRGIRRYLGSRAGSAVGRYLEYPAFASRLQGDIFHVLDHGYSHLLLALDPRRTVVTCHDLIPLLIHKRILNLTLDHHIGWTFQLRMRAMKRAAYVITDSDSTRRDVLRYLKINPERVVTIACGVSPIFHPSGDRTRSTQLRKKFNLPPHSRLVLNVSVSNEYKNISAILKAVDILRRRDPNVRFVRAGGDFSAREKQLIKSLDLEDRVHYIGGPPTDHELAEVYRMADAFAFPSLYEGFGWPPLESMRCGIPVVASTAGSLSEVLGDAALLVAPEDHAGLADALYGLMTNRELHAEMAARGIKRAASYTWERTAQQIGDIYRKVVENAGRNRLSGGETMRD